MRTRIHFRAVAVALSISLAFAQAPAVPPGSAAAPVQVNRVPAGQTTPAPNQAPSLVQKYDFGGQLRILQDPTAMDPQKAVGPIPLPTSKSENDGKAPNGFQPRTDLPLNSTALEAVRMSDTWRAGQNTLAAGPDGRVLYAYGAGLPIVVCAPLRVCMIELQPGERITGEPQIGDSVRWNVSPAMYGQGEETTSIVVLKPQEPGLDTNL